MSKKNKKKGETAAPAGTEAQNTAPVEQPSQPAPQTAAVVTEPAKPAPVYGIVMGAEELGKRHFRKGFETVLIAELGRGPGDVQNLVARLLASGEYQRVAPKAAENRPAKPVQELCNRWVGSKVLAVASEEEAAAVRAAQAAAWALENQRIATTDAEINAADALPAEDNIEAAAESEPAAASV